VKRRVSHKHAPTPKPDFKGSHQPIISLVVGLCDWRDRDRIPITSLRLPTCRERSCPHPRAARPMSANEATTAGTTVVQGPYGPYGVGTLQVNGVTFQYVDYMPLLQAANAALKETQQERELRVFKAADVQFKDDRVCGQVYTFVTVPEMLRRPATNTLYCVRRRHNPVRGSDPTDRSTWCYKSLTRSGALRTAHPSSWRRKSWPSSRTRARKAVGNSADVVVADDETHTQQE
jgi:hypothetical protein